MSKLAIKGGKPIRTKFFPNQNTMNALERTAVDRVMKKGRLSGYRGNWCPEFMGGEEVQNLEQQWQKKFNVKHAIAVNSCTSGLQIACGAIDLKRNDEVIVTPYSMTCSATAPMIYGAVPVFADIEPDYYCIDPVSVKSRITEKTKAIIAVSLFGQPYDPEINKIARENNLIVIEDAAQALSSMAFNGEVYAGSLGDIGVFSFNYGKHINCGEGGMIVTDNSELALKCQLLRNHAEAVVNGIPHKTNYEKLIGFNMRLTEINAAIISVQLEKFPQFLKRRLRNVDLLNKRLRRIPGIKVSDVRPGCTHTYYALPYQWYEERVDGLKRDVFIEAVKAELSERFGREGEGVPIGCGYIKPLYKMPLFRDHVKSSCPVCEEMSFEKLFLTLYHAPNSNLGDMRDVADAFDKVWECRKELK